MRRLINIISAVLSSICLMGCIAAADSVDQLKVQAATVYQFDAPGNYQANYKLIADAARHCFTSAAIGSSTYVTADLLPDQNRSTVSVANDMFGEQFVMTSEIVPAGDNTHVTVWNYSHSGDYLGPMVQKWTAGSKACDA